MLILVSFCILFDLVVLELHGSGGHIFADVTDEQAKKADLGVGKCFLAPIGKLEVQKMQKYFCKTCESEFDGSPKIQIEESPNEPVADGLILKERGQYTCGKCSSIIGEYRVFEQG
jgi:DNA-directed RNA polymerase subunit RPC12/RpoP